MSKHFLTIAIISIVLSTVFTRAYIELTKSEPKYIIACKSIDQEKRTCIKSDTIFTCANRKYKKIINNEIFSYCVEHKV